MNKNTRIQVKVSKLFKDQVEAKAKKENTTVSQKVRDFLYQWLNK